MEFGAAFEKIEQIAEQTVALLPHAIIAILLFAAIAVAASLVKRAVRRWSAMHRRARNVGIVLGRLIQGGGILVALLVALTIMLPGFTPTKALGALGLGGIAAGFAFKDILQNFLAGILLLLTEPFRIGDQIVFGEFEGTIEEIETRATKLRTYDARLVVIPNAALFTNAVIVNTAYSERRLEYDVEIGYGDDLDRARELMLEAMRSVPDVLDDPAPDALVVALGPSGVAIRARWWIQPPRRANALDQQDRVLAAIKTSLQAHGIDLPFPTRQVLFHDQTEATDGDRRRQREGWPAGDGEVPMPRSLAPATASSSSDAEGDAHARRSA